VVGHNINIGNKNGIFSSHRDVLKPGKPQLLFEMPVAHPTDGTWYDASADGSRFVVLEEDDDELTHVTLVFSFFDEVRRILAR
jgi:hypothetical protein